MIVCPLCCENYVFISSLCEDCIKVKRMMALYSKTQVIDIFDSVLVRRVNGISAKTDKEINKINEDIKKD